MKEKETLIYNKLVPTTFRCISCQNCTSKCGKQYFVYFDVKQLELKIFYSISKTTVIIDIIT